MAGGRAGGARARVGADLRVAADLVRLRPRARLRGLAARLAGGPAALARTQRRLHAPDLPCLRERHLRAGLSEIPHSFALLAGAPIFLWLAGAWTLVGPREGRGLRAVAAASAVVALVAIPFTLWPLRLVLPVSRPTLEALADRAEAGLPLDLPAQAGLLRVVKVDLVGGVLLVTSPDPSGSVGLARCEPSPGGEPWGTDVGGGWQLVQQD